MPRRLRTHYHHAIYHVMLRGNFKNNIFSEEKDYRIFLKIIEISCKKYGCVFHLYCLMTNHIHLVVKVGHVPLCKIMQCITASYAGYFNEKLERQGHLFQGRYKAKLVTDEAYLMELCYYIHNNPLGANMVDSLDDYPWSSHHAYQSQNAPFWLKTNMVLNILKKQHDEEDCYSMFMLQREKYFEKPAFCTFDKNGGLYIVDTLNRKAMSDTPLSFGHVGLVKLTELISNYLGVNPDHLKQNNKTRKLATARQIVTYFAHYRGQRTLKETAYFLNRNPDCLSRSLHRFLQKMHDEPNDTKHIISSIETFLLQKVGNDPTI